MWIYTDNKLAKFHENILSKSENIAKRFRGLLFLIQTVYLYIYENHLSMSNINFIFGKKTSSQGKLRSLYHERNINEKTFLTSASLNSGVRALFLCVYAQTLAVESPASYVTVSRRPPFSTVAHIP